MNDITQKLKKIMEKGTNQIIIYKKSKRSNRLFVDDLSTK